MRQPGVEPGSTAWKATMLTATPLTPYGLKLCQVEQNITVFKITSVCNVHDKNNISISGY